MLNNCALRFVSDVQVWLWSRRSEQGQTLAEYSMIITVIAVGLVLLAVMVFREALTGAFNAATNCLDGTC